MGFRVAILQNGKEIPLHKGKSQIQKHYLTQNRHTLDTIDELVRGILLPMVRGKNKRERVLEIWTTHFSELWNGSEGEMEKVWDKLELELKKETVKLP